MFVCSIIFSTVAASESPERSILPPEITKEKSSEKFKEPEKPVLIKKTIVRDNIRDKLMEIFVSWDDLDRKLVIRNASSLNLENFGPQNKSMLDWINLFAELAIELKCL